MVGRRAGSRLVEDCWGRTLEGDCWGHTWVVAGTLATARTLAAVDASAVRT